MTGQFGLADEVRARAAEDLAFLAMCCHRLGDPEQAQSYFSKLLDLRKQKRSGSDESEIAALVREAEELLGGR